jgi:soluble lytic murein transglycosylase-like protein
MSSKMVMALLMVLLPSLLFAFCFDEAAKEYNVPVDILRSIAEVESNRNPLAVGYNKDGTIDYGLMQINSSWYGKLGHQMWADLTVDVCSNVKAGAWILSQCIKTYGNTPEAIGCYHAVSPEKRMRYARKVLGTFKQASYRSSRSAPATRTTVVKATTVDNGLFFPKSSSLFFTSEEGPSGQQEPSPR